MNWKNGKRWVYSITYDEGCEALLEYALPVHRQFGVPGHVALVASQIGVLRNVPGSRAMRCAPKGGECHVMA